MNWPAPLAAERQIEGLTGAEPDAYRHQMPRDLTLEDLKQIRDEVKKTNSRLDQPVDRLTRLEHREVESETRLAMEIVAVAGAVDRLRDLLVTRLDLRDKVQEHDKRIAVLEQKLAQ